MATPGVTVYEVPDVLLQPSKVNPDTRRTSGATTLPPDAEVETKARPEPRAAAGRPLPAGSHNAVRPTADANSVSQPDAPGTNSPPTDRKSGLTQTGGIQPSADGKPAVRRR